MLITYRLDTTALFTMACILACISSTLNVFTIAMFIHPQRLALSLFVIYPGISSLALVFSGATNRLDISNIPIKSNV